MLRAASRAFPALHTQSIRYILNPIKDIRAKSRCSCYTATMMISTEQARAIAAMRKVRAKTCPVCGVTFQAVGKQRFDSKACANKASYRRVGRTGRGGTAPTQDRAAAHPVAARSYDLAIAGALAQAEEARSAGNAERAAYYEGYAAALAQQAPSPVLD